MNQPVTDPVGSEGATSIILPDFMGICREALASAESYSDAARSAVNGLVTSDGRVDPKLLEQEQLAAHGLAWLTTYVAGLRELLRWAERLNGSGRFGELEQLILQAGFGEYMAQLIGGIAISQGEVVRPADLGIADEVVEKFDAAAVRRLRTSGSRSAVRIRIAELIADKAAGEDGGDPALDDDTLVMIRDQFRRFASERVQPDAHSWHLRDELIPIEIVREMGEMGVFGLTVPEDHGGLGMGKVAMCVVTEELSRAYIGVGSLGTRSEIAAELIRLGGTDAQK